MDRRTLEQRCNPLSLDRPCSRWPFQREGCQESGRAMCRRGMTRPLEARELELPNDRKKRKGSPDPRRAPHENSFQEESSTQEEGLAGEERKEGRHVARLVHRWSDCMSYEYKLCKAAFCLKNRVRRASLAHVKTRILLFVPDVGHVSEMMTALLRGHSFVIGTFFDLVCGDPFHTADVCLCWPCSTFGDGVPDTVGFVMVTTSSFGVSRTTTMTNENVFPEFVASITNSAQLQVRKATQGTRGDRTEAFAGLPDASG